MDIGKLFEQILSIVDAGIKGVKKKSDLEKIMLELKEKIVELNQNIIEQNRPKDDITDADRKLLKSFQQYGFVGIQEEKSDHSKVIAKINKLTELAKLTKQERTIKIIAYYGDRLLGGIERPLNEALDNGVKVKLLVGQKGIGVLENVESLEKKVETKKAEKTNKGLYSEKTKNPDREKIITEFISTFLSREEKNGGSFECHVYTTEVRYAAIIIDDEWAWWTPYHPGIIVEKTVDFELAKEGSNPFIDLCISHFDVLWDATLEWKSK
jgi:hypothetical protein